MTTKFPTWRTGNWRSTLTFQSLLRVSVAGCIDRSFPLNFSTLKVPFFLMRSQWWIILLFLRLLFFSGLFQDFPLIFGFHVAWLWCTWVFCLGFTELLESVNLCFIIFGTSSGIIFQIFFLLFLLFFAFWDSNYIYVRTLILSNRSLSLNLFQSFLCTSDWIISINLPSS